MEFLLLTVCLGDDAPEGCEEAYTKNWPGVNLALYGPEHRDVTVHELCRLAHSCPHKRLNSGNYVRF